VRERVDRGLDSGCRDSESGHGLEAEGVLLLWLGFTTQKMFRMPPGVGCEVVVDGGMGSRSMVSSFEVSWSKEVLLRESFWPGVSCLDKVDCSTILIIAIAIALHLLLKHLFPSNSLIKSNENNMINLINLTKGE